MSLSAPLLPHLSSDKSPGRTWPEVIIAAVVAAAAVLLVVVALFFMLEHLSALSAAHAIAGLGIIALALPFLALSGVLLQAFAKWCGIGNSALQRLFITRR